VRGALSQAEFGRRPGCTQAKISSIEIGRTEPDMEFLQRLSQQSSVDLNWLITGQSSPSAVKEATGD
jgi:transcriptional regulator with XRE-family HTH domain